LRYYPCKEFLVRHRENILNISALHLLKPIFSIKPDRTTDKVIYLSAIAHQLGADNPVLKNPEIQTYSTENRETIYTIAVQISHAISLQIENLLKSSVDSRAFHQALQGLTVQATPTGHLQFEFNDAAIAHWLNQLISRPFDHFSIPGPQPPPHSLPPSRLFPIQHAHARCCSLLRLAHETQLIQLNHPAAHPHQWQILTPNPFPWLGSNQQFPIDHPAARKLIRQLLLTLDHWSGRSPQIQKRTFHLTEELAKAFQETHRHCQFWGNFRTHQTTQCQAYLGLILATQRGLSLQLQTQLGMDAPTEL
jgi:hypothetical protein